MSFSPSEQGTRPRELPAWQLPASPFPYLFLFFLSLYKDNISFLPHSLPLALLPLLLRLRVPAAVSARDDEFAEWKLEKIGQSHCVFLSTSLLVL